MAIAHQQTQIATFDSLSPASSITLSSFAVGSGTDRTLVALVLWEDETGSSPTGSSVVFNTSENFTYRVRAQVNYSTDNYITAEIWTLDNPTNTTANVVATFSESADSAALIVLEYTGANNGIGSTTGSATGQSTNPSVTFTTDNATGLIVAGVCMQTVLGDPFTPGSGTTERADGDTGGFGLMCYWGGEESASGGSDTIDATASTSLRWAIVAVELNEAAGGGGNPWYAYAQQ